MIDDDLIERAAARLREAEASGTPIAPVRDEPVAGGVAAAVGAVLPAMEIVGSRIRDWNIGLLDTIADNAPSGRLLLGEVVMSGALRPMVPIAPGDAIEARVAGLGSVSVAFAA